MQFEIGMSTSRYLPASGTAGFARSLVSGNRRVPWPPPMMTERTLLTLIDWRPLCKKKRISPAIYCQPQPQGKPRMPIFLRRRPAIRHDELRKLVVMMRRDADLEPRLRPAIAALDDLADLVQPRDDG